MKIWHFTRTPWGGAGQYCLRLSAALRKRALDSHVLVGHDPATNRADSVLSYANGRDGVLAVPALRLMPRPTNFITKAATRLWVGLLNRSARATFHTGFRPGRWQPPHPIAPEDIVHLHGLTGWLGFNALEAIIPQGARVFWTAHDLWPLSGGCVLHEGCDRYINGCHSCPLLPWPMYRLSCLEFDRKRRFIRRRRIMPIANSRWTAQRIRSSPLFAPFSRSHALTLPRSDLMVSSVSAFPLLTLPRSDALTLSRSDAPDVPVVPPIIDDAFFEPPPRPDFRTQLQLPADRHVLGLGARALTDQAKGIPQFLEHLAHHPWLKSKVTVLLAGDGTLAPTLVGVGRVPPPGVAHKDPDPVGRVPPPGAPSEPAPPCLDCRFLGPLTDPHQLARFYHACDLFISPSRMETFGMMLLEAQACGTPVLAFSAGGTPEALCPPAADGLVAPNDFPALLSKLSSLLAETNTLHQRGLRASQWVRQNFSADTIAQRQQAIYESILR